LASAGVSGRMVTTYTPLEERTSSQMSRAAAKDATHVRGSERIEALVV
jgi:hypothetical protein